MAKFQAHPNLIRKILQSKFFLIFVIFLFFFMVKGVYGVYVKNKLARENVEITKVELANLKEKRDDLLFELNKVSTDRGVEEELRKNFSVAAPGEKVIVVVEDDTIETAPELEVEKTWWQKFWSLFF